jgi:hypothetical protein
MNDFCQDRDLLAIEPTLFTSAGFAGQELLAGVNGVCSGTAFTSSGSNFTSAGIAAGMVLSVHTGSLAEGRSLEIISVTSATQLSVSLLRRDSDDVPIPPAAANPLSFAIRTFGPQIRLVSATLAEKLRQISEVSGIASADFADSAQLRAATAHGVLASVFLARADNAEPFDANWSKAEHYRRQFQTLQMQLRLAVDADGDGTAEQTRTLGNISLRRV